MSFAELSEDIFRAFPIVTLAYTCQFNLFPIISSLKSPTKARVRSFVGLSLTTCFLVFVHCVPPSFPGVCTNFSFHWFKLAFTQPKILLQYPCNRPGAYLHHHRHYRARYCIIGTFGYLTFTSDVQGNVLLNYDPSDVSIIIGRLAVAAVITFSYPLLAHACFGVVDEMFFDPERWDFSYCRRGAIMAVLGGVQSVPYPKSRPSSFSISAFIRSHLSVCCIS